MVASSRSTIRRLTEDNWANEERFMVIRGLNRIRTSIPLWFLQRKGQRVDEWKGMGRKSGFYSNTCRDSGIGCWSFSTLRHGQLNSRKTPNSAFRNKLLDACEATKERGNDYYQGKIN